MTSYQIKPTDELRESVDCIWYEESPQVHLRTQTVAFPYQELLINYGDSFRNTGAFPYAYTAAGSVLGLTPAPLYTTVQGRYQAIGVLLKPGGLYRLFGFTPEKPDTFRQLFGPQTTRFLQRLQEHGQGAEKVQYLQSFLREYSRPRPLPAAVRGLLTELESTPEGRIQPYVRSLEQSHKTFIRNFVSVLGLTPKKYLQMVQINQAVRRIITYPEQPLTEVGYESGFYDQAHFIRTFQALAGMTPGAYRRAVREQRVTQAVPNTVYL
ncbi:helix-turn-helix domain-containing protein [Siphonobacter sp.]|uniref:helix-turn-helix domain-containing protein n=1 Tax=Siphonobacter sp. TaxID=1869184 RepID=UPI003B3B585E